ncbi:glycoside hydrolase family 47 protein [Conidiobolus coronatus NRRL 28638]|uniref:alpha-1,2-Mannosidase n=1 Tax=Conidiobolus coronatus (strain ATCC 28846 / CBS 209.66 / NRRL 28638) TaxID=796925 RepID=A0A137NR17_CONC2|nr:glycoside hydrolase family 47 protein [Conidiobolus coronatus NRRL 28638]|eukprot:KXN65168.1 glycoside hydrolase family 47 protein [Conidiobolus coronatus NRRL 28638]
MTSAYTSDHISNKAHRLNHRSEFSEDRDRKNYVKEAFLHTWSGYKKYAWGKDSLKPMTSSSSAGFGNWCATLVDILTSLWLMNLKDEFKESVDAIKKIDFTVSDETINCLKLPFVTWEVLVDKLFLAFETPSGYHVTEFIIGKGPIPGLANVALAAIRSCQLEFSRLTQITKDKNYEEKAMATGNFKSLKRFNTLVRAGENELKYFIRINRSGQEENIVDHLALFMGGLLQYEDFVLNTKDSSNLGLKITETGYQFIRSTSTHLAPDSIYINDIGPLVPESKTNYLRPESRWDIFKTFKKYSITPSGFAESENTQSTDIKDNQLDYMESFWLAEALKYLYLIYSDDSF